jgi:hypothetical protein
MRSKTTTFQTYSRTLYKQIIACFRLGDDNQKITSDSPICLGVWTGMAVVSIKCGAQPDRRVCGRMVEWSNDWLLVVSKPKPQRTRGGFCQGHHCLPLFWCPFSGLGHFSRESALSLSLRMETNAEESITDTPHSQHDRKNAPSQQPKNQKQKTTRLMMACLVGASASEPKADPETAPLAQ